LTTDTAILAGFVLHDARPGMCQKGDSVERRQAKRKQIEVDIEIAQPGGDRCYGFAGDISRRGVSVHLWKGELPQRQRSVILNFRIWTGRETLYRKMYARVIHSNGQNIGLEFTEHDFVAEAIIHDLMYYQKHERRRLPQAESRRETGAGASGETGFERSPA
jgi:PilZ domain